MTERGKIQSGGIVFDEPINLPEGTEVVVRIKLVKDTSRSDTNGEDFERLPFFGMWADRDDMSDSGAWVRREREEWQQRLTPQR